jgi:hypothetical protein
MDLAGHVTILYAFIGGFACCDGASPTGPPTLATDGNFYGTTRAGGQPLTAEIAENPRDPQRSLRRQISLFFFCALCVLCGKAFGFDFL